MNYGTKEFSMKCKV